MAINFPRNIKLSDNLPLDTRLVVANETERTNLQYIYEGLVVFQQDNKKLYVAVYENNETVWKEIDLTEKQEIYIRGYYFNNEFYTDSTYQTQCPHNIQKIYIDLNSSNYDFYHYEIGKGYLKTAPIATSELAGLMKLYQTHGQNTDGTMSQKTITDGVQSIKFVTESIGDIDNDGENDYMLVLDLPWD